jgi:hypothetical protein
LSSSESSFGDDLSKCALSETEYPYGNGLTGEGNDSTKISASNLEGKDETVMAAVSQNVQNKKQVSIDWNLKKIKSKLIEEAEEILMSRFQKTTQEFQRSQRPIIKKLKKPSKQPAVMMQFVIEVAVIPRNRSLALVTKTIESQQMKRIWNLSLRDRGTMTMNPQPPAWIGE